MLELVSQFGRIVSNLLNPSRQPWGGKENDKYGQCVECGFAYVTRATHVCIGMEEGRPWVGMALTGERIAHWSVSEQFRRWARRNKVKLDYHQLLESGIELSESELRRFIKKEN